MTDQKKLCICNILQIAQYYDNVHYEYSIWVQLIVSTLSSRNKKASLNILTRSLSFSLTNRRSILKGALNQSGAVTIRTFFRRAG